MTWASYGSLSSINRGTARGPWHWPRLRTDFGIFPSASSPITGDTDFAYGYVFAGCLFAGVLIVYFCVLEAKAKRWRRLTRCVLCVSPQKAANRYLYYRSTVLRRRKFWTGGQQWGLTGPKARATKTLIVTSVTTSISMIVLLAHLQPRHDLA
ncbi:LOW QUALITY PROTEIN: hypothetical protein IFM46972_10468 [Aspergillus udagawae]|uniref:Uncharacterized protein n=1 Tax=Aspergillus udagawae TaxID=91492 RepID=A0A8H3XPP7_9EURO|nr:LOW QUALITY PROTEIN: hypothetical protein IFM46972_10468 [Aspergillus udagawae]